MTTLDNKPKRTVMGDPRPSGPPSTFGNDKPLSEKRRAKLLEQIGLPDFPDGLLRAIEDVQLTGLRKIDRNEEDSPMECNAEWHFARFNDKGASLAPLIYSIAFHLAKESGEFFVSAQKLARFLHVNGDKYIYAAIHLLVASGFFEVIEAEVGKSVKYRPVGHKEWAQRHPGYCTAMQQPEHFKGGDELGRQLYGIMGGEHFFEGVLKGFRKSGLSDEEICDHAKIFMQDDRNKGSGKERRKRFGEYLKPIT